MSYRHDPRTQTLTIFFEEVIQTMNLEKWVIIKELIATVILGFLAFRGISPAIAVFFIGVINTVSIAELYRAFRQVQENNRDQISAETTETKE